MSAELVILGIAIWLVIAAAAIALCRTREPLDTVDETPDGERKALQDWSRTWPKS